MDEIMVAMLLTMDEAEALSAILAKVGGDPVDSARKHSDSVQALLHNVGIDWYETSAYKQMSDSGSIYFKTV